MLTGVQIGTFLHMVDKCTLHFLWPCYYLLCLQVTNPPRSTGHDITELHSFITDLVSTINYKYGNPSTNYVPVHYLERHVPLHERMAFYRCVHECGHLRLIVKGS